MPLRHRGQTGAIPLPENPGNHLPRPCVAVRRPAAPRWDVAWGAAVDAGSVEQAGRPVDPAAPEPAHGAVNGVGEIAAGGACALFTASAGGGLRLRRQLPFAPAIAPPTVIGFIPRAWAHGI